MSDFVLSARGQANLLLSPLANDFTFIVGDATYPCPTPFALFLSPRVARVRFTDPTITSFSIQTPDPDNFFPAFLDLARGLPLSVTELNRDFFGSVALELSNAEICDGLFGGLDEPISLENAIEQVRVRSGLDRDYAAVIEFIAVNFRKFSSESFSNLDFDFVHQIISHPRLRLSNEDSLFEFITIHFHRDQRFFSLLEFVRFEFLSSESIVFALDLIADSFDLFNYSLFAALRPRLLNATTPPLPQTSRYIHPPPPPIECPFRDGSPLDGIIAHLSRVVGKNVHEAGVVEVTAKSRSGGSPTMLVDLGNSSYFTSEDKPSQWITYEFKDATVVPKAYSLTSARTRGWHELINWVVEGSNDGENWTELDRHEQSKDLLGPRTTATFQIDGNKEAFNFIQLRQIGKNATGYDYLSLEAFEIFGTFIANQGE
jgi:hypothetical protein